MTKINWKVRINNKMFWVTIIPMIILLIQIVGSIFGIDIELGDLEDKLLKLANVVFAILAVIGVTNDPTTAGYSDSERAMTYDTPKED